MNRFAALVAVLLFSTSLGLGAARADEGMWTFDNFPAAAVKARYGVDIDQAWLDHVRASAVRLSVGCSASIVSDQGLVLTNHHCVSDCAQALSTAKADYIKTGFAAATRRDEKLCAGMQAEILLSIADVTSRVQAAFAGKTGGDYVRARDAEIAAIEQEACTGKVTQRCQVLSLYQGGQYKLYVYRKYADVRLVFAPELQMAFFGGDPDNFNFPRYDLDFSFVRLYEDGRPAATADHLTWSSRAPVAGEPVFVAGNPGATNRQFTADQLAFLRNFILPGALLQFSELRGRYIRFGEEGPEKARTVTHDLFGTENTFKALRGQLQALSDDRLIPAKRDADAALKAHVDADPALKAAAGDPWGDIARIQPVRAGLYDPYILTEARAGFGSELYAYARGLVRAAEERTRPNGERLPEYTDSRLPLLQKLMFDPQPVEPAVEQLKLEFWLSKVREYLTADAPETKALLGQDSPEALSARLATSRLGDPAVRKALWDGGLAAVRASNDPLIRYVLQTDAISRGLRRAYEAQVSGPTDRAAEAIARARFAAYGASVYPDATFSLRLSYGTVQGWTSAGRTVEPVTRLGGLYDRATGQPPFDLPRRWLDARSRLNLDTVFDVSTSNDIIGGNSGSPLVDAHGAVIGAIFDGNIHSLGGAFGYDPALNRAVAVSTAAITEALSKVYGQTALVAELTGRP